MTLRNWAMSPGPSGVAIGAEPADTGVIEQHVDLAVTIGDLLSPRR